MTDLDQLLDQLADAADGKRRLPVVKHAEAEAIVEMFHDEVDRGCAARARAAEAAGHPVACKAGCNHCCKSMPAVFAGEALTIARWLEQPEHAAAKAGFLARYQVWRAKVGDCADAWAAAVAARDMEGAVRAADEVWTRQVTCAFDDGGNCSIYPVRPTVCRHAHAVDTADHCRIDTAGKVATFPFPPLDEYVERIRPVSLAIHQALRQDGVLSQPVCVAVHELVGRRKEAPGRNAPSRCGSGKKYKKCHGA